MRGGPKRRVYLVGEGPNELGGRANPPPYARPDELGVLEALLSRVAPDAFEVRGARCWSKATTFKAGGHASAEARRVMQLHNDAVEADCDVLALARDQDGDDGRFDSLVRALADAAQAFPSVEAIAGLAVQAVEGWLLAVSDVRGSERVKPRAGKKKIAVAGVACTADMVELVNGADLDALPDDATSLRAWLERARKVLGDDAQL